VCWAAFTLVGPGAMAGIEPLRATTCATCATCAGALLLGAPAAPDLPQVHWSALPTEVWLNVAFLAVGAAALANLLHYRGGWRPSARPRPR